MTKVIGVFDTEFGLGSMLDQIYAQDIAKNNVRVVNKVNLDLDMPRAGIPIVDDGEGSVRTNPIPLVALGANSPNSGGTFAPFAVLIPGLEEDRDKFYQNAIRNGGTVVVVETDADHAARVQQIMNDAKASNVTQK